MPANSGRSWFGRRSRNSRARKRSRNCRKLGARTVHFTPDPYFSLDWKRTRLTDEAMRAFDALVYCKSYEREQYEAIGKPTVYMPPGYCDEVHRPLASRTRAGVMRLVVWVDGSRDARLFFTLSLPPE